jgi:hypothetical protein
MDNHLPDGVVPENSDAMRAAQESAFLQNRQIRRYRSKLSGLEVDAVVVDALDYDGMCEIVRWCAGRPIGEDTPGIPPDRQGAVIAIDRPGNRGTMYVVPGDWVAQRHDNGEFFPIRSYVMKHFELVVSTGK